MATQRLLAVLKKLDYGTDVEYFPNTGEPYKTTVGEWLDRHDGDSELAEYVVQDGNEIFFASPDGEILSPEYPVFIIQE